MRLAGYEAMEAALANGATITPIIDMPPVTSNHPNHYVDAIFEKVLTTFSKPDTLVTSLQDWKKGRCAEVQEVNGWVVDMLKSHGKSSPMNQRVVDIAFEIESGEREFCLENAKDLLAAYEKIVK
jgi:2-dehydropantoate 2-reductase